MRYLFTNRFGGVSEGAFSSLNLAFHVTDNSLHVKANREILRKQMGVRVVVFMEQVHGDRIVHIEESEQTPTCDAMITNQKGIALAVMVADCVPILFYDAVHEAIGVAHAGREGS
ncbi:MAG: laccase domain-containing protein, partial [Campylobacterales bacterium]|nr:laccase domain-containing protein [Campylobacterales bacterium]